MVNVRFGDVRDHADIEMETLDNGRVIANVGFLQDHHVYRIHIKIGKVVQGKVAHEGDLPIIESSVKQNSAGSEIILSVHLDGVHGHLQSIITVDSVEIAVRASVLKSQDGTPSLKRGVSIVSKLDRADRTPLSAGK